MKKLYRKGIVHPSPPIISDHLSFLSASILTLTAALSAEDKEVLAYLISCSDNSGNYKGPRRNTNKSTSCAKSRGVNGSTAHHHPPSFDCVCFGCYMSYWVRWDSSPNQQLIHEIIDAFEDGLLMAENKKMKSRKERRKRGFNNDGSGELKLSKSSMPKNELGEPRPVVETVDGGGGGEEGTEKGSVGRFVSFIGERIWGGVWN
ncbi:hypothetical protein CFOL_v3_08703 [Cephalotus follicularis]|uniref:Uncharacterized protein n=1 Tax=Cephalotus follicularis TaxID=3775 RepID=A0A1Q3BB34_CEPFO|nr:hypothetical protein CFOL_v3_08703 [Cephalotus follicularis]